MASASMIVLCASALFVQTISANCLRAAAPSTCGFAAPAMQAPIAAPWAAGCGSYGNIVNSAVANGSGGGLGVTTTSSLAPSGLSVLSDNAISGQLEASGNLPLMAAVAVEGVLPTSGAAGTEYSCGDGQVGISAESLSAAGLSGAASYGAYPAVAARGFNSAAYAPRFAAPAAISAAPCGCY